MYIHVYAWSICFVKLPERVFQIGDTLFLGMPVTLMHDTFALKVSSSFPFFHKTCPPALTKKNTPVRSSLSVHL